MTRRLVALVALATLPAAAFGQPPRKPWDTGKPPGHGVRAPHAHHPTFTPYAPWYGNYFAYPPSVYSPYAYYPYFGYADPFFPYYFTPRPVVVRPPLAPLSPPTPPAQDVLIVGDQNPAVLTLEFPAAAEVWVDGKPLTGKAAAERTLTSPMLKEGQAHTFAVTARWTANGKTYQSKLTEVVKSGDRTRVQILRGTVVEK